MSDETERVHIDFERMFPEAARRFRVLEELKRSWASVVGIAAARHSRPCVLGVNAITVSVDSDNAANMIHKMKGNIMRALSGRSCKTDKDFVLKTEKCRHRNAYESHS